LLSFETFNELHQQLTNIIKSQKQSELLEAVPQKKQMNKKQKEFHPSRQAQSIPSEDG
jgi:hypothetical protein